MQRQRGQKVKETDPRKGYRGTPEPTARWGLRGAERDPRPLSRYREGAQEGTGGPQRPHSRYREGVWGTPQQIQRGGMGGPRRPHSRYREGQRGVQRDPRAHSRAKLGAEGDPRPPPQEQS